MGWSCVYGLSHESHGKRVWVRPSTKPQLNIETSLARPIGKEPSNVEPAPLAMNSVQNHRPLIGLEQLHAALEHLWPVVVMEGNHIRAVDLNLLSATQTFP